jgi:hypothetical protein
MLNYYLLFCCLFVAFLFVFWNSIILCSPNLSPTCEPESLKCWEYRCMPPYLATTTILSYHLLFFYFSFFFLVGLAPPTPTPILGLDELRAYTLNHSTSPFLWWCFWGRVSWTICPGWLWTSVLLISTSWIARITGTQLGTGFWTQGFTLAKQELYCLIHTSSPICYHYFGDGILWTICLVWPLTTSLLISASQVPRITGMRHQPLAKKKNQFYRESYFFIIFLFFIKENCSRKISLPFSICCVTIIGKH